MISPAFGHNASNVIPHRPTLPGTLDNSSKHYLSLDVSSRFGVRLRQLRKENNLTQLQMAVNFGIDRTFISDVERGRKSMSLPMLEIVALGFKLSLSDLLKDI